MRGFVGILVIPILVTNSCAKGTDSKVSSSKEPLEPQGFVLTRIIDIEPAFDCPNLGYTKTYQHFNDSSKTFRSTTCYKVERTNPVENPFPNETSLRLADSQNLPELFSKSLPGSLKEYCDQFDKLEGVGGKKYFWLGAYFEDPYVTNHKKADNGTSKKNCFHDPEKVLGITIIDKPASADLSAAFDLRVLKYFKNLRRVVVQSVHALNLEIFELPSSLKYIDFVLHRESTPDQFQNTVDKWSLKMSRVQKVTLKKEKESPFRPPLKYDFVKNLPELVDLNTIFDVIDVCAMADHPSLKIVEINAKPTGRSKKCDLSGITGFRYQIDQAADSQDRHDKMKYTVEKFYYHK